MILTPDEEMKIFADRAQLFTFSIADGDLQTPSVNTNFGERPSETQNWQNVCLLRP